MNISKCRFHFWIQLVEYYKYALRIGMFWWLEVPENYKKGFGVGSTRFFGISPHSFEPIRISFEYAVTSWNERLLLKSGRDRANRNLEGAFQISPICPKITPNPKSWGKF